MCGGEFIPCENVSDTPETSFRIEPHLIASRDDIDYIVHSHTIKAGKVDPRIPSVADMHGQIDTDLPWAIAYCDGETVTQALTFGDTVRPPLEGRECVLNVADCLTLVTDYYAERHDIHLPAVPRAIDWCERGEDLINDNLARFGFTQVTLADARPGDAVLFKLPNTKVANHIGVYLGNNEVLHSLWGRLSCIDQLSTYAKYVDKVVRHKDIQ